MDVLNTWIDCILVSTDIAAMSEGGSPPLLAVSLTGQLSGGAGAGATASDDEQLMAKLTVGAASLVSQLSTGKLIEDVVKAMMQNKQYQSFLRGMSAQAADGVVFCADFLLQGQTEHTTSSSSSSSQQQQPPLLLFLRISERLTKMFPLRLLFDTVSMLIMDAWLRCRSSSFVSLAADSNAVADHQNKSVTFADAAPSGATNSASPKRNRAEAPDLRNITPLHGGGSSTRSVPTLSRFFADTNPVHRKAIDVVRRDIYNLFCTIHAATDAAESLNRQTVTMMAELFGSLSGSMQQRAAVSPIHTWWSMLHRVFASAAFSPTEGSAVSKLDALVRNFINTTPAEVDSVAAVGISSTSSNSTISQRYVVQEVLAWDNGRVVCGTAEGASRVKPQVLAFASDVCGHDDLRRPEVSPETVLAHERKAVARAYMAPDDRSGAGSAAQFAFMPLVSMNTARPDQLCHDVIMVGSRSNVLVAVVLTPTLAPYLGTTISFASMGVLDALDTLLDYNHGAEFLPAMAKGPWPVALESYASVLLSSASRGGANHCGFRDRLPQDDGLYGFEVVRFTRGSSAVSASVDQLTCATYLRGTLAFTLSDHMPLVKDIFSQSCERWCDTAFVKRSRALETSPLVDTTAASRRVFDVYGESRVSSADGEDLVCVVVVMLRSSASLNKAASDSSSHSSGFGFRFVAHLLSRYAR